MLKKAKLKFSGVVVSLSVKQIIILLITLAFLVSIPLFTHKVKEIQEIRSRAQTSRSVFYASPNGSSGGNGSEGSPWDLQTVLNHPSEVQPGDTIYLLPGEYGNGGGNSLTSGVYDILLKGSSHLQKRFEGVTLTGGENTHDWTENEADELTAGDVNGDNILNIDDIARIKTYYTDFKVSVSASDNNSMLADVDKDGYITIKDLALAAVNWTALVVKGDD